MKLKYLQKELLTLIIWMAMRLSIFVLRFYLFMDLIMFKSHKEAEIKVSI